MERPIPNRARGEAVAEIDGKPYLLRLNMNALAKIEAAVEARSLAEIGIKLALINTEGLMGVLGALLEAGGNPVPRAEMGEWPPSALASMQGALQLVFEASGMTGEAEAEAPKSTSQSPGESGLALSVQAQSEAA
jgi:hypothetical protein